MRITLFNNVSAAYITSDNYCDGDWGDIAALLTYFNPDITKDDDHNRALNKPTMFNLWQFKEVGEGTLGRKNIYVDGEKTGEYHSVPNTVRRAKENAIGVWGIVLDYDGCATINEAVAQLAEKEFALFTSYRHSPELEKFRVVLPFSRMMPLAEFESKVDDIKRQYPLADKASFSVGQAMYLHCGNPAYAQSFVNCGVRIDPDAFEATAPAVTAAPSAASVALAMLGGGVSPEYQQAVLKSLLSCSNVRYSAGLLLATICKSVGLHESEFDQVCMNVAGGDSSLRTKSARKNVWVDSGDRVTAAVRDKFIGEHGGVPIAQCKPSYKDASKIEAAVKKLEQLKGQK